MFLKRVPFRQRFFSTQGSRNVRAAIIGSGPAGFYTADRILKLMRKHHPQALVHIDFYDALPTPFGLIRFGVAPDHPEVRQSAQKFESLLKQDHCRFLGNVRIGEDVSVNELRTFYDALVFSYGAREDRRLDIPGEHLRNVVAARSFVGWYNAYPDDQTLDVQLNSASLRSSETAVVVGHGNVALDVARILVSPLDLLRKTDMTTQTLDALSQSAIRRVLIVGRRGPLEMAFSAAELRELAHLPGCRIRVAEADHIRRILCDELVKSHLRENRPKSRLVAIIQELLDRETDLLPSSHAKECVIQFFRRPSHIFPFVETSNEVGSIEWMVNEIHYRGTEREPSLFPKNPSPSETSILPQGQLMDTGQRETVACGLIIRSIGYRCVAIPGIPFDQDNHVIPNVRGRVLDPVNNSSSKDAQSMSRLYVAGWTKRGPVGVLSATMQDAYETADTLVEDWTMQTLETTSCPEKPPLDALLPLLRQRGVRVVTKQDWWDIDQEEIRRGQACGKPREKFVSIQEIFSFLNHHPSSTVH